MVKFRCVREARCDRSVLFDLVFVDESGRENFCVKNHRVCRERFHLCPRASAHSIPMNPMITIDDTDEEVIYLDSSQDTINVADNDQSEHSIDSNSLSNSTVHRTDATNENAETNDQPSEPQTCDNADTPKPLLKVMFRDEGILR